jgi:hypothetical protein
MGTLLFDERTLIFAGDYNDAAWWSTVEIHVGIICACLPSVRSLFVSLGATSLGSSKGASRPTYGASNSSKFTNSSLSKNGTLVKEKAVSAPKHGDEEDFIPLVDLDPSKNSGRVSTRTIDEVGERGHTL